MQEEIKIPRVDIAGTLVSNVTLGDTINIFNNVIERNEKIRVCVTPVNCVVWANKNESLKKIYNLANLTLCDGVPMIWASKFLKNPLKGRVTGLDLLPKYAEESARKGFSMFLLGAKDGVGECLKKKFQEIYPDVNICGVYSPPFAQKFSDEETQKMIDRINAVAPNVLWVSFTAPKQDYWIAENIDKLNVNIAIGVGGAFEVTAGLIKRAPGWMQRSGLEWLYRFYIEPKRMFKRYFVEAPVFIPLIIKQRFLQVTSKMNGSIG